MLLRNNGTGQLVDLDGKPVEPFVGPIPCCRASFLTTTRRAATIMVEGVEILTGWPMPFKKEYRDHVEGITGGKANFYVGRPGPWFAGETAEPEWVEWGGAYVRLENGQADLSMFNEPFWVESTRRARNTCLDVSWILMGAFDKWWYRHGNDPDKANPMRPQWNVQAYDFRIGKGAIVPGSFRDLYLQKFVASYGPLPCILWEDGNEIGVGPFDDEFTLSMRDRIRHHEQTVGGGLVHLFGTQAGRDSVERDRVDMVIRHQQTSIAAPIHNKPSFVSEYNPKPAFSAARMFQMYCDATAAGTYTFSWRHSMEQAEYENALRLIAGGCGIVPPTPGCKDVEAKLESVGDCKGETFRTEVKSATDALGDLSGRDPQANLKTLAAKIREQTPGLCAFGGIEAVFIQRPDAKWVENHAVFFGDGGWSGSGFGKVIGCHREKTAAACGDPSPGLVVKAGLHLTGRKPQRTYDSRLLVGPRSYCDAAGFTGRNTCPVRPEGHPEREACEELIGDPAWGNSHGTCDYFGNLNPYRYRCWPDAVGATLQVCDKTGAACDSLVVD